MEKINRGYDSNRGGGGLLSTEWSGKVTFELGPLKNKMNLSSLKLGKEQARQKKKKVQRLRAGETPGGPGAGEG